MTFEAQDYREMARDIYAESRDGDLTEDERTDLLSRYEEECSQVQSETCSELQELRDAMDVFSESLDMSRPDIMELQRIIFAGSDGYFWPGSFVKFEQYKNEANFEGGLSVLLNLYTQTREYFGALSLEERKNLQAPGGRDGVFGRNTFKYMLSHNLVEWVEETQEVVIATQEMSQWDETVVDTPELEQQEAIEYNNGIEMTDEEFEAAKIEARENGENPSYDEFRSEVRSLTHEDKMQLQEVVGANVDGMPWIGTYTHYLHSKIREAGFSVTEAASLKRIFSEWAQEELSQIESTYDIDLSETPLDISVGDFIRYDVNYWNLTIVDGETGETVEIDVAVWTFDTIEVGLRENNPDIIFQTLAQIRRNRNRSTAYVTELQNYISENNAYEQARNIFCRAETQETDTGTLYTVDFRWEGILTQMMTASDIFGDIQYLKNRDHIFIRRSWDTTDFLTYEWNRRLSVVSGTWVMMPNEGEMQRIQEHMDLLERQAEIREAMENNLLTVLQSEDTDTIEWYFTISSEREQRDMLRNIESTVARERLFPHMRSMFTRQSWEWYVFDVGDVPFLWNLRAFTLFGDYKNLRVDGEEYQSIRSRIYRNEENTVLSIISWETVIHPVEESLRTEEDYEILNEYPELARELGEWVTEPGRIYGEQNDCGWAVGRMLLEFWLTQFPNEEWNIFSQLSDLPEGNYMRTWRFGYMYERVLDHMVEQWFFRVEEVDRPHDARPGAIIVFGQGAQRGSDVRRHAGHVEIKWNDGQYHSYYSSSRPGGSARSNSRDPEVYARHTGFVGKAYYPIMRF